MDARRFGMPLRVRYQIHPGYPDSPAVRGEVRRVVRLVPGVHW